jgi:two-component system chemotaxis sensor kinase CheA
VSEMSDYLQTFIDETDEQLDDIVEVLLVLEREPESEDELNEAFRLVHSIKGAAGMMGFETITALTHHLESRFEILRAGLVHLDEQTMNVVLRCIDFLRQCVERLRGGEQLESAGELLEEVMALSEQEPAPPAQEATEQDDAGDAVPTAGATTVEEAPVPDAEDAYRLTVHFEPGLPLADLKARLILSRLAALGEIASTRPDPAALENVEALAELHVVLTSEESADTIRTAVNLDGVESIDLAGGAPG